MTVLKSSLVFKDVRVKIPSAEDLQGVKDDINMALGGWSWSHGGVRNGYMKVVKLLKQAF